jgi:putative transcriptional regulator
MISHHPDNDMLFDYASGSLQEEFSLVVAAHLAFCELCRDDVRSLESLGGALLAEVGEEDVAPDALDAVLAQLDTQPAEAAAEPPRAADSVLPGPVYRYVGGDPDDLRWRRVAPHIEESLIASPNPRIKTSLLRIKPGTVIPSHGHGGQEYTLILKGGIVDGDQQYRRGDVMRADESQEHRPVAAEDEECICLAVLDAPIRLTGFFHRLLNPFLRGAHPR